MSPVDLIPGDRTELSEQASAHRIRKKIVLESSRAQIQFLPNDAAESPSPDTIRCSRRGRRGDPT
jgi:hypothetical protein